MNNLVKWISVTGLALATVMGVAPDSARAQFQRFYMNTGVLMNPARPINPNWLVGPGLTLRQWAYNTRVTGRALSSIPPYWLGYNPYPPINYGPSYPQYGGLYNPYLSAYGGGYGNPYASLYTAGAYGGGYGGGSALYTGAGLGYGGGSALTSATGLPLSGSGYDGGANPYTGYGDPYGGGLAGTADVINAQGKLVIQLETAKVIKEKAEQAKIDTRRRLFDEIMYERAHTPSFTDQQEKLMALNLRRSRDGTAAITEVYSGKALNDILADLKRLHSKKGDKPDVEMDLDPEILKQINVTGGGAGNIGLLRNDGQLNWPLGLRDLKPADASKEIRSLLDSKALEAVRQAANGKVNAGVIKDLQSNVNQLHKLLARNVSELPTNQYIEAKRFLNNFDEAIKALQHREVGNYFNETFKAKGKNVPDLVEHMLKKGLTFAPAMQGDEAAYQALHQALANYDAALHQKVEKE
jgi:hypothetical protein